METPPVDQTVNEGADFVEFNCTFPLTVPLPNVSWIFTNNNGFMQTAQVLKQQLHVPGATMSIIFNCKSQKWSL